MNSIPTCHGGIFLSPPIIADGIPIEIHVPLCHSCTKGAVTLALQADLSCKHKNELCFSNPFQFTNNASRDVP